MKINYKSKVKTFNNASTLQETNLIQRHTFTILGNKIVFWIEDKTIRCFVNGTTAKFSKVELFKDGEKINQQDTDVSEGDK